MNRTLLRSAVAVGALLLAGPSPAQTAGQKPMLQIAGKSVKDLLGKAGDLSYMINKETKGIEEYTALKKLAVSVIDTPGQTAPGLDITKPFGLRITYKAPQGPVPIDGDILLMIPVTDAAKFTKELLPKVGVATPSTEGGLTTFTLPNTQVKVFAREANGYVYATVADTAVVAEDRLPKPADALGEPTHDLSISFALSAIPEATIRNFFKMAATMAPGQPGPSEKDIQRVLDIDSVDLGVNVDPSAGKVVVDMSHRAKPGTGLASMLKASTEGLVRSSIGLSPTAVFSLVTRGEMVTQSGLFDQLLQLAKNAPPPLGAHPVAKEVMALVEELGKTDLEDLSMSVSGDGTAVLAAAVKSTAAFELKVGEAIDKLGPEIAKDAGENADKAKEMTKRNAVTLAGTPLSRIWIPLSKKANPWAVSIYLGVKENVAFVAATILDSTETVENALKQKPIDTHDPFTMTLKLKELAEAFLILDYKGSAAIKVESKGGDPFKTTTEIPVKDIAELYKLGLFTKIKERFGRVAPAGPGDEP